MLPNPRLCHSWSSAEDNTCPKRRMKHELCDGRSARFEEAGECHESTVPFPVKWLQGTVMLSVYKNPPGPAGLLICMRNTTHQPHFLVSQADGVARTLIVSACRRPGLIVPPRSLPSFSYYFRLYLSILFLPFISPTSSCSGSNLRPAIYRMDFSNLAHSLFSRQVRQTLNSVAILD